MPNPNVYYEIGLTDALGKPVFILKQDGVTLPAEFTGLHYYTYKLNDLEGGRRMLATALEDWAGHPDHQAFGVKALGESL